MTKELQLRGTQLDGKKKKILLAAGAAVLGIAGIVFLASLLLRVDMDRAREIALSAAGGGEIVGQSVDREGFWNEYSFQISNNGYNFFTIFDKCFVPTQNIFTNNIFQILQNDSVRVTVMMVCI